MQTETKKTPIQAIQRNLELIENTNQRIKDLRKVGEKEDGLMIRQYKHLKKKLTQDLLDVLEEFELPLQLS